MGEICPLQPARDRIPPNALDAEAAVISAAVLDAEARDTVRDVMRPDHCYADANRRVLEAIFELADKGQPTDIVTIAAALKDSGRLDQIGGTPYLAELLGATPAVANVETHAKLVRDKAQLRSMIAVCQKYAADGYGPIDDVPGFLQRVEQAVFDVADRDTGEEPAEDMGSVVPRAIKQVEQARDTPPGVDIGFEQLNRMIHGLTLGKNAIVAARPGMGKSAFALAVLINIAKRGEGALYESAEMKKEELAVRALAVEARIDISRLISGLLTREDWVRLVEAAAVLREIPLYLSYRPALTLFQVRRDLRRKQAELTAKRGNGARIRVVAVDHIGIMAGVKDDETRALEVGRLSKGLLWIAGESDVAMLVLSQLNRDVEKRPTKRPQLSDLKDSGSLEEDAEKVIFLYRDDYYNDKSEHRGIAEAIVAKNRNGPTRTAKLRFVHEYTGFYSLAPEEAQFDEFDSYAADEARRFPDP